MLPKVTSKLQVLAKVLSSHANRRRPSHASARTVLVTLWFTVWFHMSVSKNTAVRFAIEQELSSAGGGGGRATPERIGTGTLLINLDADNIMAESYPLRLMEEAARGYQRGLVVWKQSRTPGMGGTCGRIATWLQDGWEVGVYDEEPGVVGSGSQDIDFKTRVLMLARGTGKQEPLRRLPQRSSDRGG